jgi:hypothetical protein
MVYIYVLQLENTSGGYKYYIGKTNDPKRRLVEHCNSEGSSWTKIYKPIKIIKIYPNCSDFDEDKYTLEYMSLYGIDNVRGGSFCNVFLSVDVKAIIQRMIRGSLNKCFKCGKEGHFSNNCKLKYKPYSKSQLYSKYKNNMKKNTKSTSTPTPTPSPPPPTLPVPELIKIEYPFMIPNQIPELIKIENPFMISNQVPTFNKYPFVPYLIKMF